MSYQETFHGKEQGTCCEFLVSYHILRLAALLTRTSPKPIFFCGAVLISKSKVLTGKILFAV